MRWLLQLLANLLIKEKFNGSLHCSFDIIQFNFVKISGFLVDLGKC